MNTDKLINLLKVKGFNPILQSVEQYASVINITPKVAATVFNDDEVVTGFMVFIEPSNDQEHSMIALTLMVLLTTTVTNLTNGQATDVLNYLGLNDDKLPKKRSVELDGFLFTIELVGGLISYRATEVACLS
ncbi:hypothetical protein G7061_04170 [Erysipelothrix sp. HDW6B]|uniref:hypothetical protein n=1 Tax=Erysipelothrix sp. HDW6B TaxID=2714929 RepID=UPI00140D83D3|nr:hypothetical protein [Erysipelothrix sp. HDW6B]QIK85850.1 hypothetical protein G7061_04170 [Erysipelothrix sp. HDW6B]